MENLSPSSFGDSDLNPQSSFSVPPLAGHYQAFTSSPFSLFLTCTFKCIYVSLMLLASTCILKNSVKY